MAECILETRHICKQFPGTVALDDISIRFEAGRVHALLGENGAGKSTLVKIISGVYEATSGEIYLQEEKLSGLNPKKSKDLGIAIIHQELNLIPELSIAENVFLGKETLWHLGILDRKKINKTTAELLSKFHIDLKPGMKIKDLSVAQQQIVEIAKGLTINSKVFILDEPTDVLTDKETRLLFQIVRELKVQGKAIIYITHRLEELPDICDCFTVLRDGRYIGEGEIKDFTREQIVKMMVGRDIENQYPYLPSEPREKVLRLEGCVRKGTDKKMSFAVHSGEVVGLYGLVGAGRTELARAVIGLDRFICGKMYINEKETRLKSPRAAHKSGVYYSTENRKEEGIIEENGVDFNITVSSLDRLLTAGVVVSGKREAKLGEQMVKKLSVKTPGLRVEIQSLSGGNQQKVLLARALLTHPKLLILDEPTRGIDVGAKADIYEIINGLKQQGVAVLLISSELLEVMGVSDRILVMRDGQLMGELSHDEAQEALVMQYAFGITREEAVTIGEH